MTWCVVLLKRHSSIVRLRLLPEGAKAEKTRIKKRKKARERGGRKR